MKRTLIAAFVVLLSACQAEQLTHTLDDSHEEETATSAQALAGENSGGTNLGGANLGGANLGGANMAANNLGGANLGGANLGGANLGGTNLGGANLGGANLGGANLGGANLGGANLGGANLSATNLGGANLGGANLGGANLGGANLAATLLNGQAPSSTSQSGAAGHLWSAQGLRTTPYTTTLVSDLTKGGIGINIHEFPEMPTAFTTQGSPVVEMLDFIPTNSSAIAGTTANVKFTTAPALTEQLYATATGGATQVFASGSVVLTTGATPAGGRSMTSLQVFAVKGPARGQLKILVDGVLKATVDEYSASAVRTLISTIVVSSSAAHTITFTAAGTKHASSTSTQVDLDAVGLMVTGPQVASWSGPTQLVPGAPVAVATECINTNYTQRAGVTGGAFSISISGAGAAQVASSLASGGTSANWTGGTMNYMDQKMPNIKVYSIKGPDRGRVDIRIDGEIVASGVDLYAPTPVRALIYSAVTTPDPLRDYPDTHYLTVSSTSQKNPLSTGFKTDIDSFVIDTAGPDVVAPVFPPNSMLMSGEDLYNASFAPGGINQYGANDACIVMGLGSTAFADLVRDNSTVSGSTYVTSMVALVGKLPWGFSETPNGPKSLDSWEVIAAGPNRYCVFVLVAPPGTTHDGVVGYVKSVFRWNASQSSTIRIGAIGGGQPVKVYSGMMNAAYMLHQYNTGAKTHVAGQLAFTTATTNNVSVSVDFSSWISPRQFEAYLLGRVSGAPAFFESAFVTYEAPSGAIGVAMLTGSQAVPTTVAAVQANNTVRLKSGSTVLTVRDAATEVANAYLTWIQGDGRCQALGHSGCATKPAPPQIKRCAGAKAVARDPRYLNEIRKSACHPSPLMVGACPDQAMNASFLNIGVDPVLGEIMKAKCDSVVITDSTSGGEVNATLPNGSEAVVRAQRELIPDNVSTGFQVGFGTSPVGYTYADQVPSGLTIVTNFDQFVLINGAGTNYSVENVRILSGTYVHLNESPF